MPQDAGISTIIKYISMMSPQHIILNKPCCSIHKKVSIPGHILHLHKSALQTPAGVGPINRPGKEARPTDVSEVSGPVINHRAPLCHFPSCNTRETSRHPSWQTCFPSSLPIIHSFKFRLVFHHQPIPLAHYSFKGHNAALACYREQKLSAFSSIETVDIQSRGVVVQRHEGEGDYEEILSV